jgi:hypothetical protein
MARKKNAAAVELGKKGGRAWAASLSDDEMSQHAQKAIKARWDAYYKEHPEKLKAKLEKPKKASKRAKARRQHK